VHIMLEHVGLSQGAADSEYAPSPDPARHTFHEAKSGLSDPQQREHIGKHPPFQTVDPLLLQTGEPVRWQSGA